ncbi:ABC transporter ATP-binding protein [Amnibacterium sp.]|uniref:ABC transporter ATP-binding protein n=1 Tax=Amnibacterium sp. TaxID=1872496 RepID=UPI0026271A82|nr:ATP-binding cassette domain-containing protein [Amnibacterium sp.]MCU1473019.1 transporter related [Amnibacterium sp.]
MIGPIQLSATGIELRLGGRTILDGADLTVPAGHLAALTGPSGSGKTSLLTVLGALQAPDRGEVLYNGSRVTPRTRHPWSGRVQIAHQSFGLLSLLTAAENVELAAQGLPRARRPDRRALRTAAGTALDSVGLAARADHLVDELSGGEQQRISLARAISTGPDLMLADEPTAQLDAENRERITGLLLDLARRGATVIVATHDRELTERCGLVFTLRDGVLQ